MTARVISGEFGTATRSESVSALVSRTILEGEVKVGPYPWKVEAIISDSNDSTTVIEYGSDRISFKIDHMAMRTDEAMVVSDQVTVYEQALNGSWVARGTTAESDQVVPPRDAPRFLKVGVHTYPMQPGNFTSPELYPVAAWVDLMPANMNLLRIGIPWVALQPQSRTWHSRVTHFDDLFDFLANKGWSVILTVGTTPPWVRNSSNPLMPPVDPDAFGDWVDDIITRWGSVVDIVSIDPWNEPNLRAFFPGTLHQYLGILRASTLASDGRVPISLGSIAHCDWEWVEALIQVGMTDEDFDSVDIHPYSTDFESVRAGRWRDPSVAINDCIPARKSSLACGYHMLEETLAKIGANDKPYVISEVGVGVDPQDPNLGFRITGERSAEQYVTWLEQASRIPNMRAIAYHQCRDFPGLENRGWNSGWGLIDELNHRRAKWYALDAAIPSVDYYVVDSNSASDFLIDSNSAPLTYADSQ